jgi:FlaA1/EpsC-like NDP-sugar epimerase
MEMKANYSKFIIMIGTATVVMFGLMYLNSYEFSHVRFSETRTYMALYMGASMAVIMLLFMLGMYKNKKNKPYYFSRKPRDLWWVIIFIAEPSHSA